MKIIYTDIDGVLSLGSEINAKQMKWGLIHRFNPKAVSVYNDILQKTGAEIVVTSDWKTHFDLQALGEIFTEWAGIIKAPIGITPHKPGATMQLLDEFRALEILDHVKEFQPKSWVAIDDLYLSPWIPFEHFVYLSRWNEGIKQSGKKQEIIEKLNNNDI